MGRSFGGQVRTAPRTDLSLILNMKGNAKMTCVVVLLALVSCYFAFKAGMYDR